MGNFYFASFVYSFVDEFVNSMYGSPFIVLGLFIDERYGSLAVGDYQQVMSCRCFA
jgi:hypothetical protein